ncbi:MAG: ABC transporter substrate-binding protein [Myxococcales bacterium]|nr:ABC transporter substrate-binding protein [Myxococcales bacterium]
MRHRAQTSSVLALLLVIGAGCSNKPERDPEALVVVLPRDAEQLDPRFVSDPYGLRVSRLLFASLVTIDPRTLEVVPDLAASVVALSPTEYEVRLKTGLRFSDGTPLDAEDVAATFRGVVDPDLKSRYAHTYRRIQNIEILDPQTLRFVLREPHATFLTDLELPIVRRLDARRRIATEDDPFPVGAGPYRLVKRSLGVLELRANPHWYRGAPKVPTLRFVVIRDDNTRALRMLAGQGDLAIGSIPALLLPMFADDPRFETRSAPGVSTMYLGFYTTSPKLHDVRVRRAIGAAIDRELLVEAKYDGLARITDSWIPFGHWAYLDSLTAQQFNPDRARELLDEAGFVDPAGPDPRMRLILRTTSDRFRQSVARAIAAMLRDVGIEVDVRPSEAATLIADLNKGRFELTLLQVPEVLEPHVLSWFFDSSRIPGLGSEGANRWRYQNPELDKLFERGRTRIDRDERRAAYEQAQQILARDLPVLPLWQPDTVAVIRRGTDFDVPRDGRFGTLAF